MSKHSRKGRHTDSPDAAYYLDIWGKARSYRVDMDKKQWCDLSHQHFDWEGAGNRSWRDRRRHIAVLLHAFRRAQKELVDFHGPYQVFASVTPSDSGSDAVYVHTPNPNGTTFPMVPFGEPVLSLPPLLAGRLDLSRYRVFRAGSGASSTYTIMAEGAVGKLP